MEVDFGNYRLVDKWFTSDAMISVFLGTHLRTDETALVKILRRETPSARRIFDTEVRQLVQLRCPHLLRHVENGQAPLGEEMIPYVALEWTKGEKLKDVIQRQGPIDVSAALHITQQVCKAVAACHSEGVMHGEISPSEIYLQKNQNVKLIWLGTRFLAHRPEVYPEHGFWLEDHPMLPFMYEWSTCSRFPEKWTFSADVYSVGCVLYWLLAGHSPFSGTIGEQIAQHREHEPKSLSTFRTDIPIRVLDICTAMMRKNDNDRPTAEEACQILRTCM